MINSDMHIKRAGIRKEIVRPVYFHGDKDSSVYAFSTNLSPCGLCIITNRKISSGEVLDIFSRFFWDKPRTAVAVWSEKVSSSVFKIGMSLCPDP